MGQTEEEKAALISYRLKKSETTYKEATDVFNLGYWSLAVNRLYYAVFYAGTALLINNGHAMRSHAGFLTLIGQYFVTPGILTKEEGKLSSNLYRMRQTGDYNDTFDWEKEDIEPLMLPARAPITKIASLIR